MNLKNITPVAIANEALRWVLTIALTAGAAFAASHGWHVHVPAIPASLTITGALAFVRVAVHGIVKSFRSGKLEAELLADIKRYGPDFLETVAAQSIKAETPTA